MNLARAVASGILSVALAGCAQFRVPEEEPAAAPPAEQMPTEPSEPAEPEVSAALPAIVQPARPVPPLPEPERLLEYFRQLRRLSGADLGREHEAARSAYLRTRSDYDRVRLAMVLALPETAVSDEVRALELLEPVARNQNSGLNSLALLLHTFVQEHRRLGKSVQGMQQKLDALKEMERSLIERKR